MYTKKPKKRIIKLEARDRKTGDIHKFEYHANLKKPNLDRFFWICQNSVTSLNPEMFHRKFEIVYPGEV